MSWDDIDFPKIMYGSPTTYYVWYGGNPSIPAPNPWIDQSYWDTLDEIGINIISSHVKINQASNWYWGELSPSLNTRNIAFLCNPHLDGDSNPKFHITHYRTSLAYEKWAGEFYGRLEEEGPGEEIPFGQHQIFVGYGDQLTTDQEPFLSSHTATSDFFFCPIYFDDPYEPRTGHFILKAHASHNTADYECDPDIPLFEVRVWETERWQGSTAHFTGNKTWIFKFDDNDPTLELTTSPSNFDLSGYAELDTTMDDMEYRWYTDENEETDVQYNIKFSLGKVYEPESNLQTVKEVDVFIDWFGIYDDRGWMTVASLNPDIGFTSDPGFPETFEELADSIRGYLDAYLDKEASFNNGILLDFFRDDTPPHALKSYFNLGICQQKLDSVVV